MLNLKQFTLNKQVKNNGNFKLGVWLVSPNLVRISQGDRRVNLQPQVMDLLVYLAERYDEVVSTEELLSDLWKDRVVTNASVYSSLKQLRAALGDDVNNPTYIKTIHKRGYRLSIKPEPVDNGNQLPSSLEPRQDGIKVMTGFRKWQTVTLLVMIFAIVFSAVYLYRVQVSPEPLDITELTPEKSIAVLPFTDMSPELDHGWFSDGMSDEILNKLAQLPDLKVTGRQSSFTFRHSELDLKDIGRALGVAHLLEGSVRYDGDRVRVIAQLIRADDGFHVWSQEYDRTVTDTIAIQDDISSSIAGVLAVKLAGIDFRDRTSVTTRIRPDFSTYELYLQARSLIDQNTKLSLMTAMARLEKALELEPDYAEVHVALARVYLNLANYTGYYQEDWLRESRALAQPHVERALEINPDLAEGYAVLGDLSLQLDEYMQAYDKALSLNPNLYRVHLKLGISIMDQLRPWSDSLVHLDRALEIEPLSIEAATTLVEFLQRVPHRWEEAENIIANLLVQYPDSMDAKRSLAEWLLFVRGHPADAVPLLKEIIVLNPDNFWARAWLTRAWYMLGETGRAMDSPIHSPHWRHVLGTDKEVAIRQMNESSEGNPEIDHGRRLIFAYIHMMLHDWQGAVDLLADAATDLDSFSKSLYVQNLALNESPAMSLTVAYKKLGDQENFKKFARFERQALDIRTDNGRLRNEQYSRAMARLNALEGRTYEAMLELEHLLLTGSIDPRDLLHPAFDDMRDDPEFNRLAQLQNKRINSERIKLGLAPLTFNELAPVELETSFNQ